MYNDEYTDAQKVENAAKEEAAYTAQALRLRQNRDALKDWVESQPKTRTYRVTVGKREVVCRVSMLDVFESSEAQTQSELHAAMRGVAESRAIRKIYGASAGWHGEHGNEERGQVTQWDARLNAYNCLTPTITLCAEHVA